MKSILNNIIIVSKPWVERPDDEDDMLFYAK